MNSELQTGPDPLTPNAPSTRRAAPPTPLSTRLRTEAGDRRLNRPAPPPSLWLRHSRAAAEITAGRDERGAGAARCGTRAPSAVRAASLGRHGGVGLRALAACSCFLDRVSRRRPRARSAVLVGRIGPRAGGAPRRRGEGWQTHTGAPAVGVHVRGRGPGDSFSLPYFAVDDLVTALERVSANGGAVVHPGEVWAICRDSEGSPFALAQDTGGATGPLPGAAGQP